MKLKLFLLTLIPVFMVTTLSAAGPYLDNWDGTILDTKTNLLWEKCSMGQTKNDSCTGLATKSTWLGALNYCNGLALAGKTWRLPNINELLSLVEVLNNNPAIAGEFPNTYPDYYWTSTTRVGAPTFAWLVGFKDGDSGGMLKTGSPGFHVRCVTTGP